MIKVPHVLVVGAGIVGSSITYHLARQNVRVTLVDNAPRLVNGATETSFGWLTVAPGASEVYTQFRQQALTDWRRVEHELKGQLRIDWSGALRWYEDPAQTERVVNKLVDFSCRARLVERQEICALEPNLRSVPPLALFAENEGALNPALTTDLFIAAAREAGAIVEPTNKVLSLMTNGSRVTGVVTATGNLTADVVVLATGIQSVTLCQPFGVLLPIDASPAILMAFTTSHQFVNRIVSTPFIEIRAASDSLTLAADDYVNESVENNPQALAHRTLERIKVHWQGAEQTKLITVSVGQRPIPQDGLPIIGRITQIEGLYVSVMHAGVTLAALAGRLVATELLSNQEIDALSPYRLGRFVP